MYGYEKELQKLRRDILLGVTASSQQMLDQKCKSHSKVAIGYRDHVEIVQARKSLKKNY